MQIGWQLSGPLEAIVCDVADWVRDNEEWLNDDA